MECPMAKRIKVEIVDEQSSNDCPNTPENDEPMNEIENQSIHDKLRQFDVLDEVEGDDSDSEGSAGNYDTLITLPVNSIEG